MPGWPRWPTSRACSEAPGAYHLGFLLGPRVNAGGRVGQADLGARLLSSDDAHEVGALALRLDEFNAERRAIEREVLDQAIARIEGLYGPDRKGLPAALLVESEGWHVGVIGIVASRLVERYGRPAFVIGMDGELGKGSGRSVRGVDLGAAVLAARQSGPAGQRRRPRHGGRPHGGARARCRSRDVPRRAHRAAAWRRAAGARARHRCRAGAGGGDAGAGRHDRARRPVRRRQRAAALRADRRARRLRPAGGRGPCPLHPGRASSAAGSRPSPSAPARRRSGPRCSIRRGRSCMSQARCASTATTAAKRVRLQIDDAAAAAGSVLR